MQLRLALCVACALALLGRVAGQPVGEPWSCAAQRGPFSAWVNELLLAPSATAGPDGTPAVVASVEVAVTALVDVRALTLVAVAADGTALGTQGVAACGAGGVDGVTGLSFVACMAWLIPAAADKLAGVALANNLGEAAGPGAVPIQFVSASACTGACTAEYLGMTACALPAAQALHIFGGEGGSVQLITGAGSDGAAYDARWAAADIFGWQWVGLMPPTWGARNAWPQSQWGAFDQTLVAAVLPAPVPSNPALAEQPAPGGTAACPLLRETGWSACSVAAACSAAPATQITYQPLDVTFQTPSPDNLATCPPLAARSATRACAPPPPPCSQCSDGLLDGDESDVDCGGSLPNTTPAGQTLGQAIAAAAAAYQPLTGAGAGAVAPPPAYPAACLRCLAGRACRSAADCATGAGLVCAVGTCLPFWVANASVVLDVPLVLAGAGLAGMQSNASRSALAAAVAGAASAQVGAPAAPVSAVSSTAWIAAPDGTALTVNLRLVAADGAEAAAWGASMAAFAPRLAVVLEESLRVYEPLIVNATLGAAAVINSPYGVLVPPPSSGGSGSGTTATASAASTWLNFTPGAIAGIAVGAIVGVTLVAVGAAAAAHHLRARSRRRAAAAAAAAVGRSASSPAEEGGPTPGADDDAPPIAAQAARVKAAFAPAAAREAEEAA